MPKPTGDHKPVPATLVTTSIDDLWAIETPGAFCVADGTLYFECPDGCGAHHRVAVHQQDTIPQHDPSWGFNYDLKNPTLTPSIRVTAGCYYHGHLTNGVWTFEPDSGNGPA